MTRNADGPPQGRIGFGFQQCREAGAPYVSSRSNSQINLETIVGRRPELVSKVQGMRAVGKTFGTILKELREAGYDGRFEADFWRDSAAQDWIRANYSDDREKLEMEAEWGFKLGIYQRIILREFNAASSEWVELRSWQR